MNRHLDHEEGCAGEQGHRDMPAGTLLFLQEQQSRPLDLGDSAQVKAACSEPPGSLGADSAYHHTCSLSTYYVTNMTGE